jgi:hypothetical protein
MTPNNAAAESLNLFAGTTQSGTPHGRCYTLPLIETAPGE